MKKDLKTMSDKEFNTTFLAVKKMYQNAKKKTHRNEVGKDFFILKSIRFDDYSII